MSTAGLWAPMFLGHDRDHRAVFLPPMVFTTLAVGGAPRCAKSSVLNKIIASAVECNTALRPVMPGTGMTGRTRITVLDGKEVEMRAWDGAVDQLAGADHSAGLAALEDCVDQMQSSAARLRASGRRKVSADHGDQLSLVIIDELGFYLGAGGSKEGARRVGAALEALISRGPALGMVTVVANQRLGVDQLSAVVRDQITQRWVGRCLTADASDTVLGRGMASAGFNGALIDNRTPGVGWLLTDGSKPVLMRVDYLDDNAIARIAARSIAQRADVSSADRSQP